MKNAIQEARKLIAKNKIDEAIDFLIELSRANNKDLNNLCLLQKSNFLNYKKQANHNLIS